MPKSSSKPGWVLSVREEIHNTNPIAASQLGEILATLRSAASPANVEGMMRYGISGTNPLGVSAPFLQKLAREIRRDHELAQQLWDSNIHEARHLAAMIEDPRLVSEEQMECWVLDFNSWDICDGCCNNLFRLTPIAHAKAREWSIRPEEFVRRAGFVLMACLAVHDKQARDSTFVKYLPLIKAGSTDERNFVRKAVNWALRQIGKRNPKLNGAAIRTGVQIRKLDSRSARWIAADALRELRSDAVQERLAKKNQRVRTEMRS